MASIEDRPNSTGIRFLNRLRFRGAQLEFQSPTPLRSAIAVTIDGDGSAIGDAIASAEGTGTQAWDEATANPAAVERAPLAIRPRKKVSLGRGAQVEFQTPLPIRAPAAVNNQDGAGAASGDAIASADFTALGDFAGAATGDAIASGTFTALGDFSGSASGDAVASAAGDSSVFSFSAIWSENLLRRGPNKAPKLGRGAQYEFQVPLQIRAPSVSDGAGAAIGDSIVTAIGDYTFDGISISATSESGGNRWLGGGPQLEFHQALPTLLPVVSSDGAGSASGDSTASGTFVAFGDFAGAATGDAVASGTFSALADFAGAASGDAIAAATASDLADFAGAATGDAIASAGLNALASFAGAATGDAIASAAMTALADFAGSSVGDAIAAATTDSGDAVGSAIGDATASGGLDAFGDFAGAASGDATCQGTIEDATPVVVTPPVVTAQQFFPGVWSSPVRKKRKKRLDELDEMIAELRSRISETPIEPDYEDIYQRTLRVSQALANQPEPSFLAINNQIVLLREAIQEIDDEEVIMLLAA